MGKQSRRKNRHRSNSRRPAEAARTDGTECSSTLVQKLRHADPRTRHASLTALSATLLNPDEVACSLQETRRF